MPQILKEQTGCNEPNLTQCEVLQVSNCAASIDHYLVVQTHISCTTTKRWKSVPTISKACIFIFKSQFFSCFQIETLYNIILIQRSPWHHGLTSSNTRGVGPSIYHNLYYIDWYLIASATFTYIRQTSIKCL